MDKTGPKKLQQGNPKGRRRNKPILRFQIEEAQKHTRSNAAAARYLNVDIRQYKRYAELYGLYEQHNNKTGIGVEKGFSKRPTHVPLKDILEGKYPNYSRAKLRNRLIARGELVEQCDLCGFNERRITDNKIPLILLHKDGDKSNFSLDNLHLCCYNCTFLTTGAPQVIYRKTMERTVSDKEIKSTKGIVTQDITTGDYYDPEDKHLEKSMGTLSAEEIRAIQNELMKD